MIIPIGTKADLALKPKVTIGLIAACIIVHIIASTMSSQTGDEMFRVHRDLYAKQVSLYLMDTGRENGVSGHIGHEAANGIAMIENAEDYPDLHMGLITAMDGNYDAFTVIEDFSIELKARDETFYTEFSQEASDFYDWQRLKKREQKVLDSHVNFEKRPFCGINDDNIYTCWDGENIQRGVPPVMGSAPKDKLDSLLVNDPALPR